MDQAERERRRQEIAGKIRSEQERLGHDGPLPAFLNLFTDYMIDTDEYLSDLREEISTLRKTFVQHKHYLGKESHNRTLRRLDRAIKDVEDRLRRG